MNRKVQKALAVKITDELRKKIGITSIRVKTNRKNRPSITDSKFGGLPYWDLQKEYPVNEDGKMLTMIAQINLDKLNESGFNVERKLPQSGMLQFFVFFGDDCMYGLDCDNQVSQNGFRVVYHKQIDYAVQETDICAIGMPTSTDERLCDYFPIKGEAALDFSLDTVVHPDYGRFKELFIEMAHTYGWDIKQENKDVMLYYLIDSEIYEAIEEMTDSTGHRLLGYPYFTQFDPRIDYAEQYAEYDTLLFQMDTDDEEDSSDFSVMWGDCGVANFFISGEDLAKQNFGNVLYNWDCC